MVTPSTRFSLELNYRAPGLREHVYGLLQSFRFASRISAGNTLDGMAQQIRDVVLVYLYSLATLRQKCAAGRARSDRLRKRKG